MTVATIVVLAAAVAALATALLRLRRRFAPLEDLIEEMEKVDLSRPGPLLPRSIDGVGETEEVERLELAFLRMVRRLEAERRRAGSAALTAQEEERARVARDLHDEVNQSLTGLLLRLEAAREAAPPELEPELAETKALANQAMGELLSLARQLRPTALDDLGLAAATAGQVEQLAARGEVDASFEAEGDFSELGDDAQLVVYRVAQEALANAARHSGAGRVGVRLRRRGDGGVELEVADDGRGFAFDDAEGGLGIAGMRERALLVGGELTIESRPGRGTTVRLTVPGESGR
jgi:two-component system, NarL family, sensor histidine kinase UhpB